MDNINSHALFSFSPLIHAMLNCPSSLLLPFSKQFSNENLICIQTVTFPLVILSLHSPYFL